MPNRKAGFRLLPEAWDKLNEEMSHYRGDKPPIGLFVSQLILKCPEKLWREIRDSMDVKYDGWESR